MNTYVDVWKFFDGPNITKEVLDAGRAALAKLDEDEQRQIKSLMDELCKSVPNLGSISALELFTRLGIYLAGQNGSAQVQAGRRRVNQC